jgi:hypothetical protein
LDKIKKKNRDWVLTEEAVDRTFGKLALEEAVDVS